MDIIDHIHQHRSIRSYRPDPVSPELLGEILGAGIRASSSGNMQSYSIIVTRDQELKERLLRPHLQQSMVTEAPVLLTFCADFNRMRRWLRLRGAPDNFDNFFSFLIGAIDAILVSQNVALAAEAYDLGICYLGSTLSNCREIGDILRVPEQVLPVVGFTLGYPGENPELRYRLPLQGLFHEDTYQDYTDEEIRDLYQEKEVRGWNRYLKSDRLRRLVDEAGVENLAELYTTVKYTRENYQRISRDILAGLRETGFFNHGELIPPEQS